ncbi:hypothetical protein DOTSEDRAFT_68335 [Dothistroma septosporum NZE10]|uniref:Methyltransferase type 11 domain-containing protein n=1 Tax=Dothistroma septosporum (strain NZE10 / CBS 128990) TaxID=675120 RepID=N1Q1G6_DOTSN|nr:hypothetical protein DOTSEDRAFT_68335 [Dothistroma septosporum NZE10]
MARLDEHTGDDWGEMAKIYKKLTVGASSKPIRVILERLNALVPFSEATGILDDGTGPGPIISRIIEEYGTTIPNTCTLTATDFAPAMVDQVKNLKQEALQKNPESPWDRVSISVLDAMDLKGISDDSQSHVTAGWVFFMTPDPQKCLTESRRVLESGGVLGCSSWAGSQWMDLMKLASTIRSDKVVPELPKEWSSATAMKVEVEKAGFKDVTAEEVEVEMSFDRYEPLIDLLTTKMPHMINLLKEFSADEMQRLRGLMLARMKETVRSEPGVLHGTALIAVGKK